HHPGDFQSLQGRQRGRLPRHRRRGRARRQRAADSRQRGGARRQALSAQALQGRRARGDRRPGMRHGLRELPGHEGRRRHRVLPRGDGAAVVVSPTIAPRLIAASLAWTLVTLSPAIAEVCDKAVGDDWRPGDGPVWILNPVGWPIGSAVVIGGLFLAGRLRWVGYLGASVLMLAATALL